jgi:Zn-dependent peptidase ImmA (M78 family)
MKINHKQIIFAREYRKYTQTQLSSKIKGLSQSNLSKFEKGIDTLSNDVIERIIHFLNFPKSFFLKKISNRVENAHYRKKSGVAKFIKSEIEYSNKLVGFIVDQMSLSIEWPEFMFKSVDIEDGYTPEKVAKYARRHIGLDSEEPVEQISYLLESNGIVIVELEQYEKFDGVSFFTDLGTPMIIINKIMSNDRKRFTIAHELGHLLMHGENPLIPEHRDVETEANRFASEFLMPEEGIRNHLYSLKLSDLSGLKKYWLTSMASIIRRAKDLKCISNDTYRYMLIEMSRNGLRKHEGVNVFIDEPKLLAKAYKLHKLDLEYSNQELAQAFKLPIDVIEKFLDFPRSGTKLKLVM